MNADERLRDDLASWLKRSTVPSEPDYLESVFATTRSLRQRPGWTFPARWLPWLPEVGAPVRLALRLVVVSLLLLALAAAGLLAVGAIRQAVGDSVSGGGWRLLDGARRAQFEVQAHSNPAGDGATGSYSFAFPDVGVSFVGEVTCLRVVGADAVVGGRVTESRNLSGGQGFLVWVVDGGVRDGTAVPDQITTTPVSPGDSAWPAGIDPVPLTCPSVVPPAGIEWRPVEGDVVVADR